jgi:hypothetical protein
MTGAQDQESGWPPPREGPPDSRPGFLPPVPLQKPGSDVAGRPDAVRSPSPGWGLARLTTAAILLVSAFLPWAKVTVRMEGFGQGLDRELAVEAGVNADATGQVVPVLAVVAIIMIVWGLLARVPRIGTLAAVPGLLALLSCLIFLLRLDRVGEGTGLSRALPNGLDVTAEYGLYLSLASSLLLAALCLNRRA